VLPLHHDPACAVGPWCSVSTGSSDASVIGEVAGRVALESTSAAFQAAATPSQRPAHPTKRPGCRMTPGPWQTIEVASAGCQRRITEAGGVFAGRPARQPTPRRRLTSLFRTATTVTSIGSVPRLIPARPPVRAHRRVIPAQWTQGSPEMFAPIRKLFREGPGPSPVGCSSGSSPVVGRADGATSDDLRPAVDLLQRDRVDA